MPRPRKYETEAERRAARNRSKREYYERNAARECALARERYHTSSERVRKARATRPAPALMDLGDVLPATVGCLGLPIIIGCKTDLAALAVALQEDLRAWRKGSTDATAWDDLTLRLIAAADRRRQLKKVVGDASSMRLIAEQVLSYAEEGHIEAWKRREHRNTRLLDKICHKATRVVSGLSELLLQISEGSRGLLREAYENEQLIWQTT